MVHILLQLAFCFSVHTVLRLFPVDMHGHCPFIPRAVQPITQADQLTYPRLPKVHSPIQKRSQRPSFRTPPEALVLKLPPEIQTSSYLPPVLVPGATTLIFLV